MAAQQFQQLMPLMKVASDLFAIRGDWDLDAKKKMMTGPGAEARSETLAQLGAPEAGLVASAVISVDRDGEVTGSGLALTGGILWEAGYRASMIWARGAQDTAVEIRVEASEVVFPRGGESRSLSEWIDGASVSTIKINGLALAPEQLAQLEGVNNGFAIRFSLAPITVDKCSLQLWAVPRR